MKIVLDTSAILSGMNFSDDNRYLITENVKRELKRGEDLMRVEMAEKEGVLRVAEPKERYVAAVRRKAEALGEDRALSEADITTLSLALELREKGEEAVLATDDYGIQNIAKALSINYAAITEKGISKVLTWHYVCLGCGQGYDRDIKLCEICGSKLKRRVKRGG